MGEPYEQDVEPVPEGYVPPEGPDDHDDDTDPGDDDGEA